MGLSLEETRRKMDAYERGESNDLAGIAEPTAEKLRAERAKREELRRVFDAKQAEAATQREAMTKARYLAAGNTEADWARDKARVLSDDAMARMHAKQGGALISPAEMMT